MNLLLSVISIATIVNYSHSVGVICYYGSWRAWSGITPELFNASLCTHINYAFVSVSEDGNLKPLDASMDIVKGLYKRVTNMKQSNPNLKVLLSAGGGGTANIFKGIANDLSKRAKFTESATYFLSEYNFDGLDVDWEYPENEDRENYVTFLKEIKEAFQPKGWLLTVAVSTYLEHGYSVTDMIKYLDIINLMTYDFYGPWSKYTGQNSALYASSVETAWEKSRLNVAAAANNWVNAGAPKNKLSVGTAFYGRSFTLSNPENHELHANITGAGTDGGDVTYLTICSQYNNWTKVWDDEQKNPYRFSGDQWIGYDDPDSIRAKAAWVKENGFFGVMIWAIDQDDINGACGEAQILLKQINCAIST